MWTVHVLGIDGVWEGPAALASQATLRGSIVASAAGGGGAGGDGTVFELVNNGGGVYTPVTLLSFTGANGQYPYAGLIADAAGDLFGTTAYGGAPGRGTVFELVNHGGGAYTPVTLLSFNDGAGPAGSLAARRASHLA